MSERLDRLSVGVWASPGIHSEGEISEVGFRPAVVLARILEGTEQRGALSQSLASRTTCRDVACYVSTLGEAFNSLSTTQQDQIRNRWGSHFNEILSLSRETDAELFYEALFHLGQRLEREGHTEQAGLVYSAIVVSDGGTPPLQIIQQTQERITVLNGGGSMGLQMEHMGRGFARQALDPGLLLGATGMGLFGKGVELIGMRYLAGANFFRSATGIARTALEFAPRATGFALEATAFPFAINGANELLGRPVSWAHMDHRILGSWFFLGGMRVGGRLGASASRRLGVSGFPPVGSIGGIMLGHGGEVLAGFKEWHGFSNFTVEALGTWATLQVAGRYSDYVFGGQISRMQRVMDLFIESNRRDGASAPRRLREWVDSLAEDFNNLGGPKPLAIGAGGGSVSVDSPRRQFAEAPRRPPDEGKSYMTAVGDGGGGEQHAILERARSTAGRKPEDEIQEFFLERLRAILEWPMPEGEKERAHRISEIGMLDTITRENIREQFETLSQLRWFYMKNIRPLGDRHQWMRDAEAKLNHKVQADELYPSFLFREDDGTLGMRLPHPLETPTALRFEPSDAVPAMIPLKTSSRQMLLPPYYFRLEDLGVLQGIVSDAKVDLFRRLIREHKFFGPAKIGFREGQGYYLTDGYHRSYAARLEGKTHILGITHRHFHITGPRLSWDQVRIIPDAEFRKFVEENEGEMGFKDVLLSSLEKDKE